MGRIRVGGWEIHYVHEGPHKDSSSSRSTRVCVFMFVYI